MDKCQCPRSGFCEYYGQEMTYNPPNWQWCQGTSERGRIKYKTACEKKQKTRDENNKKYLGAQYVTIEHLIRDCRELLLPQIGKLNLKGVLGIPRSGMLPASIIALWLNIPLYAINRVKTLYGSSEEIEIMPASTKCGGSRMRDHENTEGKILVVDDTIYSGRAIANIKEKITEEAIYATVYAHPDSKNKVDFFAKELKPPHLLQWNLFNCTYIESALLDFDGIFCPNVPYEACADEKKYIDYITNVEPFYHRIPKTFCKGIVTARLEKYRDITEDWLKRHGINYGFLKMYPTEKEGLRNQNHIQESSTFKASAFAESDALFFIESEIEEAIMIRDKSRKFVICPRE